MLARRLRASIARPTWKRALAELLLIATGVFVGLAADRWKEARDERALEQHYLERLAEDLRADTAALSIVLAGNLKSDSATIYVRQVASGELGELGDLQALPLQVEIAGWFSRPQDVAYTFNELASTGNLTLTRSLHIRQRILEYYGSRSFAFQWDDDTSAIQSQYLRRVRGVLDADIRLRIENGCCDPRSPLPVELVRDVPVDRVVLRLQQIEDLPLLTTEVRYWLARQRIGLEDVRASAESLIAAVEQELEDVS